MNFPIKDATILLCVGGSRAYGIHLPNSDVDCKGVAVPPLSQYLSPFQGFDQVDGANEIHEFINCFTKGEQDIIEFSKLEGSIYGVKKFLALARESNPNIWDVLFCRDEEVRYITPAGQLLRDNKELFLSARCRHSFAGYSASQLKRIKGHRAWLLNPPKSQPKRADFGLPENTLIPADQLGAARAAIQKQIDSKKLHLDTLSPDQKIEVDTALQNHLEDIYVSTGYASVEDLQWNSAARTIGLNDNLIYVLQQERAYEGASTYWKQYQNWATNRNASRAATEAKYGYDTKHAGHLVRLLRMGREIMETGKVNVWREDAEEIRSIRNGAWTYEHLIEWAEKEDALLDQIYKSKSYKIPHSPDTNAIEKLCIKLIEQHLSLTGLCPEV